MNSAEDRKRALLADVARQRVEVAAQVADLRQALSPSRMARRGVDSLVERALPRSLGGGVDWVRLGLRLVARQRLLATWIGRLAPRAFARRNALIGLFGAVAMAAVAHFRSRTRLG